MNLLRTVVSRAVPRVTGPPVRHLSAAAIPAPNNQPEVHYNKRSLLSDGVEIPVHLIGDASFPLKPWLMKGYGEAQRLSPEQRRFSFALASARAVVDAAFMRLKGRWRCLLKKSDIDVSMMPRVVAACCVLHNICEQRGDAFLPEWSVEMAPSGTYLIQPETEAYDGDMYGTAEVIRRTMAHNLLSILQL